MEMYAWLGPGAYNFPTSPLFWGAVIFVALLVAACLLVGKRNRRRFDGRPMEEGHTKDPRFDQTLITKRWQIYGTRPTSFHPTRPVGSATRARNAGRHVSKHRSTKATHRMLRENAFASTSFAHTLEQLCKMGGKSFCQQQFRCSAVLPGFIR